ncbi:glycohydrolase toxin TNT-related protein [Sinomonas sp. P47F7]|uniref:glycohydrolase toxin TNT-related protein n=1 Tax=Sinomonas sp. P47F7 TaxID=3410987 RepID=UPI003BF53518
MGTLVEAGAIPYTNVDVEAIRTGASSLTSAAGEVRSGGAAVVSAWRPISGVYKGPGDAQLFSAMDPVGASSTAFGDDLDKVAGALRSFADQVEPIVARLKALHADALALGGKVAAFKPHETWSWMALGDVKVDSWDQDESLNNENNRIINGVADQMVEYEAAERTCANTIRSIAGLPPLHALTGASDDPLGYGYSSIPAGTKLPWGQSADREESCSEKTATFVPSLFKGIVVDGVGGTLAGLGQMVGITVHDWNFSWSRDTVTTTWGAMGTLISYNPQTGQWGDWSGAGDAWTNLGKSTIAWDEWAKDPGAAAGATIFNVGSLLIPVVGEVGKVGAAGRVGEAADGASKLSKLAAIGDLTDPVSLVAKGVHLALPKLSDLASVLGSKFDDLKGLVSDHMPNFKDGSFHFEGSHADGHAPAARAEPVAPHVDRPISEPAEVGTVNRSETVHTGQGSDASHSVRGTDGPGSGEFGHNPAGADGSAADGTRHEKANSESPAVIGPESLPTVDSAGHNISDVLTKSSLTPRQLNAYLERADPQGYQRYVETGEWPSGVQIPKSSSVLNSDGSIAWHQVPRDGYRLDVDGNPIKSQATPPAGSVIDRYGPPSGRFTSPLVDGRPFGYDQRSLPYVEDPLQYHRYEVIGDLNDIKSYYDACPNAALKQAIDSTMSRYRLTWEEMKVQEGEIAPGFESNGGGIQDQMPLSVEILQSLGLLREVH